MGIDIFITSSGMVAYTRWGETFIITRAYQRSYFTKVAIDRFGNKIFKKSETIKDIGFSLYKMLEQATKTYQSYHHYTGMSDYGWELKVNPYE